MSKIESLLASDRGPRFSRILEDPDIPASIIAHELTKAGHPISATTIKDYRRKTYGGTKDAR